jgi:L-iditol 2-dehydrogenase
MTMQAARLYGKEDLRVEAVKVPEVGAGEVLLAVKASAVCGTDIRMFRNGHKNASAAHPLVLGHEIAGVVEKVGPGVTGYREGMRVAVAPNMGCGVCDQCVSGNTQLCADYRAFGINIDGGFAEHLLVPAAAVRQGNLSEMPAGVDFAAAAVVEPLSCVYNAFQRCAIGPGDTVLVMGSGPIGLMHARLAKMGGAAKVFMNDINAERLAWCAGLEKAITPVESPNLAERLRDETHGKGVDVVITANPAPESQVAALGLSMEESCSSAACPRGRTRCRSTRTSCTTSRSPSPAPRARAWRSTARPSRSSARAWYRSRASSRARGRSRRRAPPSTR